MTINAVLEAVDALQPNAFSREEKLAWLSRAEGFVKTQILDTCQDPPAFSGYSSQTDPETVLLVPAPFDELYLRYIQAQPRCITVCFAPTATTISAPTPRWAVS